jgi:hypothetical protein
LASPCSERQRQREDHLAEMCGAGARGLRHPMRGLLARGPMGERPLHLAFGPRPPGVAQRPW